MDILQLDDGVSDPPLNSPQDNEALGWSTPGSAPLIDLTELRRAVARGKAAEVIEAISAVDIQTALQQVGTGLLRTYRASKYAEQAALSPLMLSVVQRSQQRGWVGDGLLAAEMLAELHGEEPNGRPLAIDLDELSSTMADRSDYPGGGYLNMETGEVVAAVLTDASAVGEEYAVDVEDGDWQHLVEDGGESWQDMSDFAATVDDPRTRGMLEDAVQGKGAFSRFRRAIDRADLWSAWHCFAEDRRWGRAQQELADLGLRPT